MRTVARTSIVALSMLMAVADGMAAAQNPQFTVLIPFEFTVGGKRLPGGNYLVTTSPRDSSRIVITNQDEPRLTATAQTTSASAEPIPDGKPGLVFNKYDKVCFLSQVVRAGNDTGLRIPQSRFERYLKRELARKDQEGPEIVLLTAAAR